MGAEGPNETVCYCADEFAEAVEMYREVLRSSEEHKDRLKTDSLQVPSPGRLVLHIKGYANEGLRGLD